MKTKHPKIETPSYPHNVPKMMVLPQTTFRHQNRGLQQGRNRPH